VVTSHYAYSEALGSNPGAYNTSGPSLNIVWDSRDSTINPYRGIYAALTYQWYPHWLGSAQDASLFYGEFRGYRASPRRCHGTCSPSEPSSRPT
jgi:outer membrane protein assembly factor BamA